MTATLTGTRSGWGTTPGRSRRERLAWIVVVALAGLVLTYSLWPQDAAPPQPTVVVLAGSGSTTSGSTTSDATQRVILEGALAGSARVLVAAIGAGPGAFDLVDTRPVGSNQLDRESSRAAAAQHLRRLLASVVDGTSPSVGDHTVLHALVSAQQQIAAAPAGSVDVIVLGNALDVGEGVDLSDPVQRGDFREAVDRVVRSGLLPACGGYRFHLVDATAGMTLDTLGDLQAREFYRRLFAHCGGTLALWDRQLLSFPHPAAVPAVDPVEVAAAAVAGAAGPCSPVIRLDAAVLFDVGRAVLRPTADPVLRRLLSEITTIHPDDAVHIVGHTDTTGTARVNDPLSLSRAQALRRWLLAHGVAPSRVSAEGRGAADPAADNGTQSGRALNRRVEVTLVAGSC